MAAPSRLVLLRFSLTRAERMARYRKRLTKVAKKRFVEALRSQSQLRQLPQSYQLGEAR